ncbi:hypothetical protein psyc5s11_32180 [Clostridium gelidum]|uniref:Uncharacterized protein n=1 Tax=Clostridium gelidum TaxID=704125 RepID=A0ABM7TE19_9CLOT|nr:hypothetical protein [Clostridium gelidum]BCZ47151.1 hypothetical protein psyc5s11_32180 [Clostridium gelidum]
MDDKILEILMELKEGQEEIKADIKKLDTKMDNIHEEIKKQIFDFEKANAIKHTELTDTFRFATHKLSEVEKDVFILKDKLAK